jgi:putative DNA methylase
MGARLMAIVVEGDRGRIYQSPAPEQEVAAAKANPEWKPTAPLPDDTRAFFTPLYGLKTYGDLFTDRQLVALTTLSNLVGEARTKALGDAEAAYASRGFGADTKRLAEGGQGPQAYADAIATYLAMAITKLTDNASAICSWHSGAEHQKIRATFSRQAIPMVWDYAEGNVFSNATGNFYRQVELIAEALAAVGRGAAGSIFQIDAPKNSYPVRPVIISTDPPYYDNIPYANLSDFFYVWLRRSLSTVWPDLFRRLQTPKDEELVAAPYRDTSREQMARIIGRDDDPILAGWNNLSPKDRAERQFMFGMSKALAAMRGASVSDSPLAIYYAYKQSERS